MKSGPELWAEVSDPASLGSHLGAFGPIRITRTADGSLVEWEGERAAGRLELASAGFGTRVVLEAQAATVAPAPPGADVPTAAAEVAPEPEPATRPGFWARLVWRRPPPRPAPGGPPPATAAPAARVPVLSDDEVMRVLESTLEALGSARRRPFANS